MASNLWGEDISNLALEFWYNSSTVFFFIWKLRTFGVNIIHLYRVNLFKFHFLDHILSRFVKTFLYGLFIHPSFWMTLLPMPIFFYNSFSILFLPLAFSSLLWYYRYFLMQPLSFLQQLLLPLPHDSFNCWFVNIPYDLNKEI